MEKIISLIIGLLGFTRKVGKMKDSMVISMLGGLVGVISMDMINILLFITKKSENTLAHVGGSMFVHKIRVNQPKNELLGQIWHMLTGIGLGIPIMYCLKATGINYHRMKGAFIGAMSWGLVYGLGGKIQLYSAKPRLTKTHFSYLLTDIVYGLFTAEAIKILSDPEVFEDNDIVLEHPSSEIGLVAK
ncbi:hypothetical protein [Desulfosporosinus meridiei]|uniref:Uncharacterized protein n=1 Tax=Desulfosporosinus meridiei (strain ATCC BAA-275 / DSM 13257 / KCTC 12902 / NCIMB 13706 / S10) TaxID=768704 RepID=J7IXB0_DESMD|nr:hypothetical protein [Desulfosporosinus meridiei]AFQ43331.1 hypothetical protein Desmer_1322 [Desulfosporosinus meridiei DSM 13257]